MAKTVYRENTYKSNKQSRPVFRNFQSFFTKDPQFHFVLGIFLLVSSFALFIAFFSYFFTGKADQSVVEVIMNTDIRKSGEEVENWLGLSGAVLAHVFIFKWFGIASFGLIPLIFVLGWRLAFKVSLLPIRNSIQFSAFAIFWFSLLMGALFDPTSFMGFWAGGIGFSLASLLNYLFGLFTVPVILFGLLVFLVYFFQITPSMAQDGSFFSSLGQEFRQLMAHSPIKIKRKFKVNTQFKTPTFFDKPEQEPQADEPDEFSKDIVLEVNDELQVEEEEDHHRKTRAFKTNPRTRKRSSSQKPPKSGTSAHTKLELEIDPDSLPEEPVASSEQISDMNPADLGQSVPNQGEQTKISFEEYLGLNPSDLNPPQGKTNTIAALHEDPGAQGSALGPETGPYDPTAQLSQYQRPTPELMDESNQTGRQVSKEELEANKDKIVETLSNYGIGISQIKATIGPTVTLYEIIPEAGVRISKIKNLEDDIALSLAALGIRIIAPIPGKGTIGIEVPNKKREIVGIRLVTESEEFRNTKRTLPMILGKSVTNEVYIADLAKMPHLLIAGATGQGKSVGLNVFLTSLIYKKHPSELKFVLIDPKKVELTLFNKIEKHFLAKLPGEDEAIITDTNKVISTLASLCREMDIRYNLLKEAACRNIKEYNAKFVQRRLSPRKGHRFLPYIVLVVDELADLMMVAGKEVEQPIARLAQLARAIGIHLIVATQRPSVDVITGIIKANFPARLSFKVSSKVDSRTILDAGGAEQLVGMGDMLFSMDSEVIRLQCPFIDTHEVERICDYINVQQSFPQAYELPEAEGPDGLNGEGGDEFERDVLFEEAARIIVMHQQGSTSLLQRRLKLGYNRAGRLIDQLEKAGIVGTFEGSKAREVLIPDEYALERLLSNIENK